MLTNHTTRSSLLYFFDQIADFMVEGRSLMHIIGHPSETQENLYADQKAYILASQVDLAADT